ncbi:uncharacterized protein LOC133525693 isoform X2 [Cydia pomonella]|uniref:uncharacterized protein LOC133525693 isoform X2 n=1 Tax=Cydia pomonella TaxID=82600 RepID=UPI002ADDF29B|nr:uncharacterized protein LOC133525693 isoform X2 [Cydia pomonella]
MLRYIYLLCFIYFELIYCYNPIHGKEHRRLRRRQEYVPHKFHKTTSSSPYESIDMINFMKPEAEVFDSYNYEKPQRLSIEELPLPRLRRSRLEPAYEQSARTHSRLHSRHLAHHPKRNSFAMFPFFSHKNKTKPKPPGMKHDKRKSHSFRFSKTKDHGYNPPLTPDKREQKKNHITEKIEGTTMKDITQNCKLKNQAKIIHNSRLYFANPYRINDEGTYGN